MDGKGNFPLSHQGGNRAYPGLDRIADDISTRRKAEDTEASR